MTAAQGKARRRARTWENKVIVLGDGALDGTLYPDNLEASTRGEVLRVRLVEILPRAKKGGRRGR